MLFECRVTGHEGSVFPAKPHYVTVGEVCVKTKDSFLTPKPVQEREDIRFTTTSKVSPIGQIIQP